MHFAPSPRRCLMLVDNGSLRAASTLSLRRLAAAVSLRFGDEVEPVSLLHSSAVAAQELEGKAAEIFEPAVRRRHAAGVREFLVLPLFFGPSAALTEYIPKRVEALARELPGLRVRLARPLVADEEGGAGDADARGVAAILADQVRAVVAGRGLGRPPVVLVDHGSPQRAVAAVRDRVARALVEVLGAEVAGVRAASMERREGEEYAFAEPLLARALREPPCGPGAGDVVVAMLFLSPGRHAGAGGDVETICREAESACPGLRAHLTALVGEHPGLVDLLVARLREGVG